MRLKFEFKNEILYKIQLGIGHTKEKTHIRGHETYHKKSGIKFIHSKFY
jgi:hypothetical protein